MRAASAGRVHAFDWLRGLAVVVMVQTHSVVLLSEAARRSPWFPPLQRIDGLVAPAFIFSAGFAMGLVQVRAAHSERRGAQLRQSLWRLGQVAAVATLVNVIWFWWASPWWWLRVDILQCIALTLGLALPLAWSLARRPGLLRWSSLGVALAIFGASPFAMQARGWAEVLLTTRPVFDAHTGTVFPLAPWAGYVFLGVSLGATVAAFDEAARWRWLGLLLALAVAAELAEPLWAALYPPHERYLGDPGDLGWRCTRLLALIAGLTLLERRFPALSSRRGPRWLASIGASSLSAYFFHQMLLNEWHIGLFGRLWKGQADWPLYWVLTAALVASTWGCVRLWERLEAAVTSPRDGVKTAN